MPIRSEEIFDIIPSADSEIKIPYLNLFVRLTLTIILYLASQGPETPKFRDHMINKDLLPFKIDKYYYIERKIIIAIKKKKKKF